MILYVPGRMPTHLGSYSSLVPGYYSSYRYSHPSYYGNLNLQQPPLELAVWPRSMPTEEDLATSPASAQGLPSLTGALTTGPPSPAHSDSDASSSSLELGSVRRGENAQLKCR